MRVWTFILVAVMGMALIAQWDALHRLDLRLARVEATDRSHAQ